MKKYNGSTTTTGKKAQKLTPIFYTTKSNTKGHKMNPEWGITYPQVPYFFAFLFFGFYILINITGKLFEKALTTFGKVGGVKIMTLKTDIKKLLLR